MQYKTFTDDTLIVDERAIVMGYHVAGAANNTTINIIDGTDATGTVVFHIHLSEKENQSIPWIPIPFNNGIYINVVSGSALGSVFFE